MAGLPKLGTMIHCVGPPFAVGSVTYSGYFTIQLPRRTDDGHIIHYTLDEYHLKQNGEGWVYELVKAQ